MHRGVRAQAAISLVHHRALGVLGGQGPGLVNVLSLLSGYSRNIHMEVIFNFHTPFHTRTPHCLTRPQAVRVTRRQTVTHPQAVTRPGTGNVHGCPLCSPGIRRSREIGTEIAISQHDHSHSHLQVTSPLGRSPHQLTVGGHHTGSRRHMSVVLHLRVRLRHALAVC